MKLMGLEIICFEFLFDKCVVVVVLYIFNWDFFIGFCVCMLLDEKIYFVGKDFLFCWLFGKIF